MRTFILLCCTTVLGFSSDHLFPQEAKVTIDSDRTVTIFEVFELIGQQTECTFIYQSDIFKDLPQFHLKSGVIKVMILLSQCLPASDFEITSNKDDLITIRRKDIKSLQQETIQVKGTVKDINGMSLTGATVSILNTSRGVVSDFDGQYQIMARPTDTLAVSFLGYQSQRLPVQNRSIINVVLVEDAQSLKEVVLNAGYYTTTDREKTGSIARVIAREIEKQPVSNPLAAMQGRMPGVNITQSTGVPGGGFDIQIRGKNSIRTDGNTPLYIVDGIPFGLENLGNTLTSAGILPGFGLSPLNSINPSDIESIEVLKDADATAIYGSRGANGVVLITTKRGKDGKTRFTINSYTAIGSVTKKLNLMKTEQYVAMREQAFINDGLTEFPFYAYDINGTWDRTRYTDWQEEFIGGTANTTNLQATVSGGSETTKFLLSATNYKETTVFPGDFAYNKTAINFNVNHVSDDKKFEVSLSGNYIADKNDLLGTDLTRQAYTLAPNAPALYNPDGTLNWENSTWENPLALLNETYLAKNNNLIANSILKYRPSKGWEIKAALGFTDSGLQESKTTPHTIYDPAYGLTSALSTVVLNDAKLQSWNFEPQISFEHTIFGGTLNAMVGATYQSRYRKQSGLYAFGFSNNNLINNIAAASDIIALSTNNSQYRYNAVFGRLNYSYNNKYLINLTGRRDGSSRFGPGKRFANFGAVGAAWIFSRENYFESNSVWLSFGKLRASYGITGSDQIGDYQYLNTYNISGLNYGGIMGLEPTRLFNPNFSWESNKKIEGAVELGMFKEQLLLTIAHYYNRSSNQLVGIPLPGTTGFSSVNANLDATVQNTGWEYEIHYAPLSSGKLSWSASLNLTVPKNELISFPNLEGSTYANQLVIGEALDIQKVYRFTGLNPQTGLYEFEDFDGDGELTFANDRQKIIQTSPQFFGGLQNSFTYNNWQLDFLFQFVKQLGRNYNSFGILPGVANNLPEDFDGAWEQPGDLSSMQPYTTGLNAEVSNAYFRYISSDAAYSDASFVRLKNLSLSYTIPLRTIISTCRLYVQGQNMLTLTNFKGPDPENQSSISLPPLKVMSFGVELSF